MVFEGAVLMAVHAAGIAFIILAFVLFAADVFMPTHGILTAGGIIALVLGGLLLVNTSEAPGLPGVSPLTIAGVAAADEAIAGVDDNDGATAGVDDEDEAAGGGLRANEPAN